MPQLPKEFVCLPSGSLCNDYTSGKTLSSFFSACLKISMVFEAINGYPTLRNFPLWRRRVDD